jgi:formylglycine-generating enzyme required for sulfatase activity
MSFVLIPPAGAEGRTTDPVPAPFYYGACELTVAQFRHFVQATGYRVAGAASKAGGTATSPVQIVQGDRHPAINLTSADAEAFCRWLSQVEAASYRLPTQAEWAHACGAKEVGRWWFGGDTAKLGRYAWYQSNSGARTHQVGLLEATPCGLHDLIGNAAEWCVTGYRVSGADVSSPSASRYVLCGGGWSSPATELGPVEVGHDIAAPRTGGLRVVLELPLEARWHGRSAASPRRSTR